MGLTTISVPALTVDTCSCSNLHLQLLALGSVSGHGVAVVRAQATLPLRPHRSSRLIGCVRAGAPASRPKELLIGQRAISQLATHHPVQ